MRILRRGIETSHRSTLGFSSALFLSSLLSIEPGCINSQLRLPVPAVLAKEQIPSQKIEHLRIGGVSVPIVHFPNTSNTSKDRSTDFLVSQEKDGAGNFLVLYLLRNIHFHMRKLNGEILSPPMHLIIGAFFAPSESKESIGIMFPEDLDFSPSELGPGKREISMADLKTVMTSLGQNYDSGFMIIDKKIDNSIDAFFIPTNGSWQSGRYKNGQLAFKIVVYPHENMRIESGVVLISR